MTVYRLTFAVFVLCLSLGLGGCGPTKKERDAAEQARIESDERSRREADAANKAITRMNEKLGRKPPALDLGLPVEKKSQPKQSQP